MFNELELVTSMTLYSEQLLTDRAQMYLALLDAFLGLQIRCMIENNDLPVIPIKTESQKKTFFMQQNLLPLVA